MIHHIYVIRGSDGKTIYHKSYGAIKIDEGLVSVFLSAIGSFAGAMVEGEVKSTVSGRLKFVYTASKGIIFVFAADAEDDELGLRERAKRARDAFMEGYYSKLATWDGNTAVFDGFTQSLEKILMGIIKIALVGFGGVGKTTILNLMRGSDIPIEYNPTIAIDVKRLDGLSSRYEIIIWDFAGQERYTPLWTFLLRGTNIVFLVTDSTVENVVSTKKVYLKVIKSRKDEIMTYCLANKQDLPRAMKPKLIEKLLKIPTYEMIAINPTFHETVKSIIRQAIEEWSRSKAEEEEE
ncbi:MAG: GTP-binding protein [Promethearchaeota archaeon]|nr:MAG: GTP-binding protein [Candidatus Lokiarchaeota archaeon]